MECESKMPREGIDDLIYRTIGCMIEVHKELGPGFLESVYRRAIAVELQEQGIPFETEKKIELRYKKNGSAFTVWTC